MTAQLAQTKPQFTGVELSMSKNSKEVTWLMFSIPGKPSGLWNNQLRSNDIDKIRGVHSENSGLLGYDRHYSGTIW
jgi:hypothetical protein